MKKVLVLLFFILIPIAFAEAPWPVFNGNLQHTGLSNYDTSKLNGAIKWTYTTGDGIESSPTIDDEGTIYFGSHDGNLYAVNPDGSLKWSFKAGTPKYDDKWKRYSAIISTPAISTDKTIYIISPDDYFYAVQNGRQKWRFPLKWNGVDFWSSATIAPDGTIYVGSSRADLDPSSQLTSGLYALKPDGTEKWHYEITAGVTSTAAIGKDGTIYINGNVKAGLIPEGHLFALTPDGKLKWKFKMQDWVETSPSVGSDGTIYTGSKEGRVYALNPDGTKKWEFSANDGIGGTPAIGKDGVIYVGSWDNTFYAINPDGTKKWSYEVEPGFESIGASASIGSDGTIYFGSTRGIFYALNPNGTEKWKIMQIGSVASSPAIGKDGTVYFGAWDKKLYALGEGQATKAAISDDCHSKQLQRVVTFTKEPGNTCIDGSCDSTATICQKARLDGTCETPFEACVSKSCKKTRSYCNIIIQNLETSEGYTLFFNENYITKDGKAHFIKQMKVFMSPSQWRSIAWQYETETGNVGYCDYTELKNLVCEMSDNKSNWSFANQQQELNDFKKPNFADNGRDNFSQDGFRTSKREDPPANQEPFREEQPLRQAVLQLTAIIIFALLAVFGGIVFFVLKGGNKK